MTEPDVVALGVRGQGRVLAAGLLGKIYLAIQSSLKSRW